MDSKTLFHASKDLVRFGFPVTVALSIRNGSLWYTSTLIGGFPPDQFAAFTLGFLFTNMTGMLLLMGLTSALETLCSQALTSGCKSRASVLFQQAVVLNSFLMIPIALVWWLAAEPILVRLGQDATVSKMAATYIKWSTPLPFLLNITVSLFRYLVAHGQACYIIIVELICFPFTLFLDWSFISYLGYGYIGHAFRMLIINLFSVTLFSLLTTKSNIRQFWTPWSRKNCFDIKGWTTYLRIGIPSLLMVVSKLWAVRALILVSGWFGKSSLSANQIGNQTTRLFVMFAIGFGAATTNLIGNAIGRGEVRKAKEISRTALLVVGCGSGLVAMLSILALRNVWARLITDDVAIEHAFAVIIPVLAVVALLDSIHVSIASTLRGLGLQSVGLATNLVSFYIVVPVVLVALRRVTESAASVWMAWCVGLISTSAGCLLYLAMWDWTKSVKQSRARLGLEEHVAHDGMADGDDEYDDWPRMSRVSCDEELARESKALMVERPQQLVDERSQLMDAKRAGTPRSSGVHPPGYGTVEG